ncbi:hypothetical protein B0H12DRAFT_1015071, partial [Mycena haematopus]
SGVGKSSLIGSALGIDMKSISYNKRGMCDIDEEITSPENNSFVLHDSMGFEHGDVKKLTRVKRFLESRSGQDVALEERVHVIWCGLLLRHFLEITLVRLCVQIPHPGGRAFEKEDEELLKLRPKRKVVEVLYLDD